MKLKEIQETVRSGNKVFWMDTGYEVINPNNGDQWFIKHKNGKCIALVECGMGIM